MLTCESALVFMAVHDSSYVLSVIVIKCESSSSLRSSSPPELFDELDLRGVGDCYRWFSCCFWIEVCFFSELFRF